MAGSFTQDTLDVSLAESATGWVGASGGLDSQVFKEGSNAWTYQTPKNGIGNGNFTPAANINMTTNYSIPHLYWTMRCDVFVFCEALNTGATNSGLMLKVSDGSGNFVQWHVDGSDTWDGSWKNFIFDLTDTTRIHSTSGTLSLADVDKIEWITDNSNSGTIRIIDNTWIDAVRYGDGTQCNSTTTEAFGFTDVALDDALTANYYGVLQDSGGVLFCQGKITLGDITDTNDTNFVSSGETVYFLDKIVDLAHYGIVGISATTPTNPTDINITSLVMKTVGASGAEFDFSDTDINSFSLITSTLIAMGAIDLYGNSTTNAIVTDNAFTSCGVTTFNQYVTISGCSWNLCGQIITGDSSLAGCTFTDITSASHVLVSSPASAANISDSTFISDGTGNGLEIGGSVSNITLSGLDFSGYSTTVDADKAIFVNIATGSMTINISGGSGVTASSHVRTAGATITVSADVTVTFTGMRDDTEVRIYKTSDGSEIAGIEDATAGSSDDRSFAWSAPATTDVYYVIHHWSGNAPFYQTIRVEDYIVPGTDTSVAINQLVNRNAS